MMVYMEIMPVLFVHSEPTHSEAFDILDHSASSDQESQRFRVVKQKESVRFVQNTNQKIQNLYTNIAADGSASYFFSY